MQSNSVQHPTILPLSELPLRGRGNNAHKQVVGIAHHTDIVPLTEAGVRFEIDMCIGCDRCMRACPVPLSAQVNIADLNLATISDEIAPHVARFTDECVMCGSCVPVCPVNNHRDLLMLSLKQRLGVPWDGSVDMTRVLDELPPGWTAELLLKSLREQPMFRDPHEVPDNYLLHFIASSKLLTFTPDQIALREGEYGRNIYFILDGRFVISSLSPSGDSLPVAVLRRGEFMGERGMLTGQQRNATAQAQTPATVLDVPEQVMQRMMEIVPSVRSFFVQLNNTRSIQSVMKRMALFQNIPDATINSITDKIQFKYYDRNTQLFSEKTEAQPARESLHIILEGFVKVARRTAQGTGSAKSDERIIAYRQSGDYFAGGLDMLGDGRAVTVSAITRVHVAEIPRQDMLAIFSHYPEVHQRFTQRMQEYQATALAAQTFIGPMDFLHTATSQSNTDAEARAGLRALVGNGVIEGTEVLVIDLDKCVHCDKCEDACERRHGHSRMNRKGMVVGNISIATACRQCQDPVCMLCSRAGIARMPGGEVYITESCIGCGICAERCPYDNISIVSLNAEAEQRSTWQRFSNFFTKGIGQERGNFSPSLPSSITSPPERGQKQNRKSLPMLSTPASSLSNTHAPSGVQKQSKLSNIALPGPLNVQDPLDAFGAIRKKIAIKCDLCAGYNNQACVQACPTGAAFRAQPAQFFGSTEEILQQRVQ
jgi:CRP-like cAMP-binding protein/Fe-S-cluster-containing hydrogenase component 2